MGGMRVYWFTGITDPAGRFLMNLTYPMNSTSTIITTPIGGAPVTLASFITPTVAGDTVFAAGVRNIHVNARTADARVVSLQATVHRCDDYNVSTGACGSTTLFATSSTSASLDTSEQDLVMNYNVGSLYVLNSSSRFIITVVATKYSGGSTDVILRLDDDSMSRIEVPSPVGVTDISGKLDASDQRYNDTLYVDSQAGFRALTGGCPEGYAVVNISNTTGPGCVLVASSAVNGSGSVHVLPYWVGTTTLGDSPLRVENDSLSAYDGGLVS